MPLSVESLQIMLLLSFPSSTSRVTASLGDTSAMDVEFPDDIMLAAGEAAMDRLSQQENDAQKQQGNNCSAIL